MPQLSNDHRDIKRRKLDSDIAAEPELMPLDLSPDMTPAPVESHLRQLRHPVAVAGVVENGVVKVLDPSISLPEHSRVIIVASGQS